MTEVRVSAFQFHKGTIKTKAAKKSLCLSLDFNSIKVRLKHAETDNAKAAKLFQFHKGTIKTLRGRLHFHMLLLFQFHKGTIKTRPPDTCHRPSCNFNSIKVRLKHFYTVTD